MAACPLHCPIAGQTNTTWRGLPRPNTSSSRKKEPRMTSITVVTLWEPLLWLHSTGITGESTELQHWESDCDQEGVRDSNTQHSALGWPSSHVQSLIGRPNQWLCSSAEPSQGAGMPDLGPQTRSVSGPGGWSAPAQAGAWATAHLLQSMAPSSIWQRTSGSCTTQQLKLRGKQIELISPKAKPGAPFVQGTWGYRSVWIKPQRALVALELLLPLRFSRKTN